MVSRLPEYVPNDIEEILPAHGHHTTQRRATPTLGQGCRFVFQLRARLTDGVDGLQIGLRGVWARRGRIEAKAELQLQRLASMLETRAFFFCALTQRVSKQRVSAIRNFVRAGRLANVELARLPGNIEHIFLGHMRIHAFIQETGLD